VIAENRYVTTNETRKVSEATASEIA